MREEFWNKRRDALAICAYMGMTVSQAAADAGLSVQTVRVYARRYGLKFTQSRGRRPANAATIRAQLQPLADEGLTTQEAADALGITYAAALRRASKAGVIFTSPWERIRPTERNEAMAAMYRAGKTLAEIGEVYGITRERVRQVLWADFGIEASSGGQTVRSRMAKECREAKREAACLVKHGCSTAQLEELREIGREMLASGESYSRTPIGAFGSQRNNAIKRDIPWSISLWEWWLIWQDSGKWKERGREAEAYVMCRFRDEGGYEVGNVYIATLRHNSTLQPNNPYRRSHPDFEKAIASRSAAREVEAAS